MSAGEFYQMVAGIGDGFTKGYDFGMKLSDRRLAREQEGTLASLLSSMAGGTNVAPAMMPQAQNGVSAPAGGAPASGAMGAFRNAISSIESGGNYGITGPVTKSGDRAYGKYQVMGANIPSWTREALGQSLTPQQFLASPEAQDRVFDHKFGQAVQKYGNPQDAASVWFTGRPLAQGAGSRDILGTSGQGYVDKFTAALGRSGASPAQQAITQTAPQQSAPPQQMAQAAPQTMTDAPAAQSQASSLAMPQQRPGIDPRLLMGVLNNPQSGAGAKLIAQTLLAQQLGPKDPYAQMKTALEVQKLQRDLQPEGSRPLTEQERTQFGLGADQGAYYDTKLGRPVAVGTAKTNVSIDQRGETEFAKEAGKSQAKRFNELVDAGQKAQANMADLQSLAELGGKIGTGKQAETLAAIGPYAQSLGIDIANLGEMQAYNAIIARIAPTLRVAGSGATSDFEMRKFLEALPSLGKTPQGNAIIGRTMAAIQSRQIRAAEIASRAMAGELKPAEAEKQLRELADPLQLWKKADPASKGALAEKPAETQGELPTAATPQDAMKLPKGTRFRDPQGNIRVVP